MKLLLLATALAFGAALPSHAAGTLREFGKWRAACDNAGHCAAYGTPAEDAAEPRTGLRISRDSGHDARIRISIDGKEPHEEETVWLDGKPFMNESRQSGGSGATQNDAALALIGRMLNAQTLALTEKAAPPDTISLTGLKAALLYIDDVQGRVGSRNAFVARGDKSAARKFAGYPLIVQQKVPDSPPDWSGNVKVAAERKVMEFHRRNTDRKVCDVGLDGSDRSDTPGDWQRLGPSLMLAEVYCWRAAYQAGSVYYLFDTRSGAARHAHFEQLDLKAGKLTLGPLKSITSPDAGDGAINSMHKMRGVGGCGEQIGWMWDGKAFRLTHQAIKLDCGYTDAGLRLYGARIRRKDGTIAEVEQDGLDEGY